MSRKDEYPETIQEVIKDRKYKREVLKAMRKFKKTKPFRGSFPKRRAKHAKLFFELCAVYEISLNLMLPTRDGQEGSGFYSHYQRSVRIGGKLSVVTLFHEFAHALGKDEKGACSWSLNLFKRFFPKSFERGFADGHCLRQGSRDV